MRYSKICPGIFLKRPNRFIAHVETGEGVQICHVKNTGRCRELLVPGARVYLSESDNPARKTRFDLIAVEKETAEGPLLINMDSQAPNRVFGEWAEGGGFRPDLTLLRPETTYGNSRFDYYWESSEKRGFVEIKGVTLEENGVLLFPDAPTQRGVKHLEELVLAHQAGYEAAACFVIQMDRAKYFTPNRATHPEFAQALERAAAAGVELLAVRCLVEPDGLEIAGPVEIRL